MSLAPKQPKGAWYAEAVAAVQKHRDDLWAAEQQGWTERRKPIVEKLKNEITRLDEKQRDAERNAAGYWEFAMWVWKEWPPKTEGRCMVSTNPPSSASAYDKPKVRKNYPVSSFLPKNESSKSCRSVNHYASCVSEGSFHYPALPWR